MDEAAATVVGSEGVDLALTSLTLRWWPTRKARLAVTIAARATGKTTNGSEKGLLLNKTRR